MTRDLSSRQTKRKDRAGKMTITTAATSYGLRPLNTMME
jgi:hypothetical protein